MIKSEQLRIGNYVRQVKYRNGDCDVVRTIAAIRQEGSLNVNIIGGNTLPRHPIQWFEPIELTEDVLSKTNLINGGYDMLFWEIKTKNGLFSVSALFYEDSTQNHVGLRINSQLDVNFKYLHELQNYFHATTGEELIYKP